MRGSAQIWAPVKEQGVKFPPWPVDLGFIHARVGNPRDPQSPEGPNQPVGDSAEEAKVGIEVAVQVTKPWSSCWQGLDRFPGSPSLLCCQDMDSAPHTPGMSCNPKLCLHCHSNGAPVGPGSQLPSLGWLLLDSNTSQTPGCLCVGKETSPHPAQTPHPELPVLVSPAGSGGGPSGLQLLPVFLFTGKPVPASLGFHPGEADLDSSSCRLQFVELGWGWNLPPAPPVSVTQQGQSSCRFLPLAVPGASSHLLDDPRPWAELRDMAQLDLGFPRLGFGTFLGSSLAGHGESRIAGGLGWAQLLQACSGINAAPGTAGNLSFWESFRSFPPSFTPGSIPSLIGWGLE